MADTRKTVFLDRDGTLIKEVDYLHNPNLVEFEYHVVPALKLLIKCGARLIIITNQSGIGRGLYSKTDFLAVQTRLFNLAEAQGIRFDDFFYCPHHPEFAKPRYRKVCRCRKPAPGMILQAMRLYDVKPEDAVMVGNQIVDVQAGKNAGIATVLVQPGSNQDVKIVAKNAQPDYVAVDLLDAVKHFILTK